MLARISGGNSGIADYLKDGLKADRHYTRDELDIREPIFGDLDITDTIIDTIRNNGQERYLHITLGFRESELPTEQVREITKEYVSHLMNAYDDEEFNFYAELHLPKLKRIYNSETNSFEDRLPHVHIVIPKINLKSGGRLNPSGDLNSNVLYFEAFQESINRKYNLASPKDNVRSSVINHKQNALGKYTSQFSGLKSESAKVKEGLIDLVKDHDYTSFKSKLSELGDVKVRNEGKDNEYLAFKASGAKNFTNLREPCFSKSFLDTGKVKLSDKEISQNIEQWRNFKSLEIKHIYDASKNVRNAYKDCKTDAEKADFLKSRIEHFNKKHQINLEEDNSNVNLSRKGNNKRSFTEFGRGAKPSQSNGVHSLQSLHERTLVHKQERTLLLLQGNERTHLHANTGRTDVLDGLRRATPRATRGIATSPVSYMLNNESQSHIYSDIDRFNKQLPSERVIDFCTKTYLIKDAYPSKSKTGEPRIRVDNRNYSNSDYLTKNIGLDWPTASKVLSKLYEEHANNKPFDPVSESNLIKSWKDFSDKDHKNDIKALINAVNQEYNEIREDIYAKYKVDTAILKSCPKEDRTYLRAVAIYNRIVALDELKEQFSNSITNAKNSIRPYYSNIEDNDMSIVDKFKAIASSKSKSSSNEPEREIENKKLLSDQLSQNSFSYSIDKNKNLDDADSKLETAVKNAHLDVQNEQLQNGKFKFKDLEIEKIENGADFKINGDVCFRDNSECVSFPDEIDKDKIALGLEYSIRKYGSSLEVNGSPEFKDAVMEVAIEKGFDVSFNDPVMDAKFEALKESNIALDKGDYLADQLQGLDDAISNAKNALDTEQRKSEVRVDVVQELSEKIHALTEDKKGYESKLTEYGTEVGKALEGVPEKLKGNEVFVTAHLRGVEERSEQLLSDSKALERGFHVVVEGESSLSDKAKAIGDKQVIALNLLNESKKLVDEIHNPTNANQVKQGADKNMEDLGADQDDHGM